MTDATRETTRKLHIDSLTHGPCGIGRDQGFAVLVPFTAPDDEAVIRITERKGRYARGTLVNLTRLSSNRQAPPCPYFGQCGGCSWQHIRYPSQLRAKEENLEQTLRRIGKLDGFTLEPIIPSARDFGYRRRIRLHVDPAKRLGFFRSQSHELIEVDSCLIADPKVNSWIVPLRGWVRQLKTVLRSLEIVAGDDGDSVVIVTECGGEWNPEDELFCSRLVESHPNLSGLVLGAKSWRRAWGDTKIPLQVDEQLRLTVEGDVFVQVNRDGSRQLTRALLEWGKFSPEDRVLELYAGAGNFTFPIAHRSGKVVAVEADPRSVQNGKANGRLLGARNIRWMNSQAARAIPILADKRETFTKIVLDPPRTGAKGLAADLARLNPEKIFYVSCDPPTLARDLSALNQQGYRLVRAKPFDLFPQSYHFEVLAELIKHI